MTDKVKQYESDYKDFIELLNKHKVEFLVVGAYAVIFHTKIPRDTKDIDFWIKDSEDNAKRCADAIKEFSGLNIDYKELIKKEEMYYLGIVPHRIDIFNEQYGLDFYKSFKNKVSAKFRGEKVYFVNIDDLLKIKEAKGREIDKKDIQRLEKEINK